MRQVEVECATERSSSAVTMKEGSSALPSYKGKLARCPLARAGTMRRTDTASASSAPLPARPLASSFLHTTDTGTRYTVR